MRKKRWLGPAGAIVVLVSLSVLVAACDGDGEDEGTTADGEATRLEIYAEDTFSFSTDNLVAPADEPFTIVFDNRDDGGQHNFVITRGGEGNLASTEIEQGPVVQELEVDGLEAGIYRFRCEVWPTNMMGTLTVE